MRRTKVGMLYFEGKLLGTFYNEGKFHVAAGAFSLEVNFDNSGTLYVESGTSLGIAYYHQTAHGETWLNSGTILSSPLPSPTASSPVQARFPEACLMVGRRCPCCPGFSRSPGLTSRLRLAN